MTRPLKDHVGNTQVYSLHEKAAAARSISADIERFKAAGGKIEVLGVTEHDNTNINPKRKARKRKMDHTFAKKAIKETISLEEAEEESEEI